MEFQRPPPPPLPAFVQPTRIHVKHFPLDFGGSEIKQFLMQFGATEVTPIGRNAAYANFRTHAETIEVIRFLHQLPLKETLLSAEFARCKNVPVQSVASTPDTSSIEHAKEKLSAFLLKINATCDNLDFEQPPPPQLRYLYPRCNQDILDSICIALETSTRFYTQVLHLMNRMNLEPPFVPGNRNLKYPTTYASVSVQTEGGSVSSEESELESSGGEEVPRSCLQKRRVPAGRTLLNAAKRMRTIIETEKTRQAIKPHARTDVKEVFTNQILDRNIKIVAPLALNTAAPHEDKNIVYDSFPTLPEILPKEEVPDIVNLAADRLTASELSTHPLFENYTAGSRSNKLYIKNLAKSVEEVDLRRIYERFSVRDPNDLDVRIMKTGRMKGQAFITFRGPYEDEDDYASVARALHETNGYMLNGKVMVVMFGKKQENKE